jgi:hypothetical protein
MLELKNICTHSLFLFFFRLIPILSKIRRCGEKKFGKCKKGIFLCYYFNYHKAMDESMLSFYAIPYLYLLDYG